MKPSSRVGFAAAILSITAQSADAHIVGSRLGDFYAGALHPLTDLQDDVLWTALGLLAGSLGATHGRWLVLLVPPGLLLGLSVGLSFGSTWIAPLASAGMMILLGLLLAAGLAMYGYVFITLITALTVAFRRLDVQPSRTWRDIAIRACGSWIAAIGLMVGGFALAT